MSVGFRVQDRKTFNSYGFGETMLKGLMAV